MELIWKSVIMILATLIIIRVSGRKSVSQLTIATTVVMISIGTIVAQPMANKNFLTAIGTLLVIVGTLMFVEYLQLKFDFLEMFFKGKSVTIIENGVIQKDNLKKLRLTVDSLEMQLRQKGVKKMQDIKTATFEPNGQVGYELFPDAEPLTLGEFKKLLVAVGFKIPAQQGTQNINTNIFDEVKQKNNNPDVPEHLQ